MHFMDAPELFYFLTVSEQGVALQLPYRAQNIGTKLAQKRQILNLLPLQIYAIHYLQL